MRNNKVGILLLALLSMGTVACGGGVSSEGQGQGSSPSLGGSSESSLSTSELILNGFSFSRPSLEFVEGMTTYLIVRYDSSDYYASGSLHQKVEWSYDAEIISIDTPKESTLIEITALRPGQTTLVGSLMGQQASCQITVQAYDSVEHDLEDFAQRIDDDHHGWWCNIHNCYEKIQQHVAYPSIPDFVFGENDVDCSIRRGGSEWYCRYCGGQMNDPYAGIGIQKKDLSASEAENLLEHLNQTNVYTLFNTVRVNGQATYYTFAPYDQRGIMFDYFGHFVMYTQYNRQLAQPYEYVRLALSNAVEGSHYKAFTIYDEYYVVYNCVSVEEGVSTYAYMMFDMDYRIARFATRLFNDGYPAFDDQAVEYEYDGDFSTEDWVGEVIANIQVSIETNKQYFDLDEDFCIEAIEQAVLDYGPQSYHDDDHHTQITLDGDYLYYEGNDENFIAKKLGEDSYRYCTYDSSKGFIDILLNSENTDKAGLCQVAPILGELDALTREACGRYIVDVGSTIDGEIYPHQLIALLEDKTVVFNLGGNPSANGTVLYGYRSVFVFDLGANSAPSASYSHGSGVSAYCSDDEKNALGMTGVKVDGMVFGIEEGEATCLGFDLPSGYVDNLTIPDTVTYDGKEYPVTAINLYNRDYSGLEVGTLTIGPNVIRADEDVIRGLVQIDNVVYNEGLVTIDYLVYRVEGDHAVVVNIADIDDGVTEISIPDTVVIDGHTYPVTKLNSSLTHEEFNSAAYIQTIHVGSNVSFINSSFFGYGHFDNLSNLDFADLSKLTYAPYIHVGDLMVTSSVYDSIPTSVRKLALLNYGQVTYSTLSSGVASHIEELYLLGNTTLSGTAPLKNFTSLRKYAGPAAGLYFSALFSSTQFANSISVEQHRADQGSGVIYTDATIGVQYLPAAFTDVVITGGTLYPGYFNSMTCLNNITLNIDGEVGKNTMYGCALQSLTLGEGVTSIDNNALYGGSLVRLTVYGTTEINSAFSSMNLNALTIKGSLASFSLGGIKKNSLISVELPIDESLMDNTFATFGYSGSGVSMRLITINYDNPNWRTLVANAMRDGTFYSYLSGPKNLTDLLVELSEQGYSLGSFDVVTIG